MSGHRAFAFDTFDQFKYYWNDLPKNYVWHHIVEQSKEAQLGSQAIHNVHNVVAVPAKVNQRIADYYNSKRPFSGGQRVRDWLRSSSYDKQREFGLTVMQKVISGMDLP